MNVRNALRLLTMGLLAGAFAALAADPPTDPARPDPRKADQPALKDHYRLMGRDGVGLRNQDRTRVQVRDQVQLNRPELSTELRQLMLKFRDQREAFLKQEAELIKQLKDATEQQRELIREQIRQSLDQWREEQKLLRDRVRERIQELRSELQDDLKKVVDAAKEENQNRRGK